jgi:hypothetical protein
MIPCSPDPGCWKRSPYLSYFQLCYSLLKQEQKMSADTVEKLITNAIHAAFIKYPEGDGGPNLDYEWIPPEHSSHITKAILLDLAANGFKIVALRGKRWVNETA